MANTDLCMDPLTSISNLFGLLESDISFICGSRGVVIAFDIVKLDKVNKTFGRETGDAYIKSLAALIHSSLRQASLTCPPPSAFRTGDDEFILILPERSYLEAEKHITDIRRRFKEEMARFGIENADFRTAILPYSGEMKSATLLIKGVSIAMAETRSMEEVSSALPDWADDLIEKMVGRVMETLSLLRQANTMAYSDEISGLQNHRAAELALVSAIQEYNISQKPFSILFIDGDNLKQYNDMGYKRGNQMIRDLGALIANTLRHNDKVYRWLSGDEFMVLLENTDRHAALRLGERIRSSIEEGAKDWPIPITVSVGIASCPHDGTLLEELLVRAETANSVAKRLGKNKVTFIS